MPRPVTMTIAHDLGLEEARRRIQEGSSKLRDGFPSGLARVEEEWTGDDQMRFAARGLVGSVSGVIDVFPQHVRIEVVLPNLLASVAEAITGSLEREAKVLLEKK
ncbi:MAG: polyhydroxyalkanoic acid system family protein [Pseudomonadota bacterium]